MKVRSLLKLLAKDSFESSKKIIIFENDKNGSSDVFYGSITEALSSEYLERTINYFYSNVDFINKEFHYSIVLK